MVEVKRDVSKDFSKALIRNNGLGLGSGSRSKGSPYVGDFMYMLSTQAQ